jgi:hypothetical protein
MIGSRFANALATLFVLALAGWLAGPVPAQDLRQTGRRMAEQKGDAIVTVQVVISMTFQGSNERERRQELNGTVLSEDGLTLAPLSELDPSETMRRLAGPAAGDFQFESRIKDLRLVHPITKKELDATVVLRDPDLDLAFIRPTEKPEKPFVAIDPADGAQPQLLEQVFVLARMGKVANRAVGVMTGEIQAIVEKPRKFFIPSSELASAGMGVPTFSAEGRFIGIVLMRTMAGAPQDTGERMIGIILPAEQVARIAEQATPPETE